MLYRNLTLGVRIYMMNVEEKKMMKTELEHVKRMKSFIGTDITVTADFEMLEKAVKLCYSINSVPIELATDLNCLKIDLLNCKKRLHELIDRTIEELENME